MVLMNDNDYNCLGIGLETVKTLLYVGCKVISGGRSVDAAKKSFKEADIDGHKNLIVYELDLENLSSIKSFADKCLYESRIDFLILNAGIMALPKLEYTVHGFEKQIGTNHYGHFYLTKLLLDKMKAQTFKSRIIAVSSKAHTRGKVDLTDIHFKKDRKYDAWLAYGQSKCAMILFVKELADQLEASNITCLSLHPGVIATGLSKHLGPVISHVLLPLFVADKNVAQGAATTIAACFDPSFDTEGKRGSYLSDCQIAEPNEQCQDVSKTLRKQLWEVNEKELHAALQHK